MSLPAALCSAPGIKPEVTGPLQGRRDMCEMGDSRDPPNSLLRPGSEFGEAEEQEPAGTGGLCTYTSRRAAGAQHVRELQQPGLPGVREPVRLLQNLPQTQPPQNGRHQKSK